MTVSTITPVVGTDNPTDGEFDRVLSEISNRRRNAHRRRRTLILSMQIGITILFFGCWQLFSGDPKTNPMMFIDAYFFSSPLAIWQTLVGWFADGSVWHNILATTLETVFGFLLGAVLGFIVGLLLGSSETLGRILNPFIAALNSVPRLALVPLFILWFGLGLPSKVIFVTGLVFFLVFFSTFDGVRQRSQDLVNTLKVMGASRSQLMFKITIPSAMTWVFAGLRVSVPFALVAAVTAEIISSSEGLGYLLVRSSNQFYVQGVFAAIVLMVVLSMIMLGIVVLFERWLVRWNSTKTGK